MSDTKERKVERSIMDYSDVFYEISDIIHDGNLYDGGVRRYINQLAYALNECEHVIWGGPYSNEDGPWDTGYVKLDQRRYDLLMKALDNLDAIIEAAEEAHGRSKLNKSAHWFKDLRYEMKGMTIERESDEEVDEKERRERASENLRVAVDKLPDARLKGRELVSKVRKGEATDEEVAEYNSYLEGIMADINEAVESA